MEQETGILDIIILAMIAGFIALRLRSVLGNKTGHEKGHEEANKRKQQENPHLQLVVDGEKDDEVFVSGSDPISLDGLSKKARKHLETIMALEPNFSIEQFMDGASYAYPMILQSFWDGNMSEVESFLNEDVYNMFSGAVTVREQDGLTLENNLIKITEKSLVDITIDDREAKLTVKFVSDIVLVTRDEAGDLVDGDATDADEVVDIWTFKRELGSKDPNWVLSATRAG